MNKVVRDKLINLQVGGCTCLTKTPELKYHDPRCTHRLAAEIYLLLEAEKNDKNSTN